MKVNDIMTQLEAKHPGESEYLQAVREVLTSIEDVYNQHPEFEKQQSSNGLSNPTGFSHSECLGLTIRVKFTSISDIACNLMERLAHTKAEFVSMRRLRYPHSNFWVSNKHSKCTYHIADGRRKRRIGFLAKRTF